MKVCSDDVVFRYTNTTCIFYLPFLGLRQPSNVQLCYKVAIFVKVVIFLSQLWQSSWIHYVFILPIEPFTEALFILFSSYVNWLVLLIYVVEPKFFLNETPEKTSLSMKLFNSSVITQAECFANQIHRLAVAGLIGYITAKNSYTFDDLRLVVTILFAFHIRNIVSVCIDSKAAK